MDGSRQAAERMLGRPFRADELIAPFESGGYEGSWQGQSFVPYDAYGFNSPISNENHLKVLGALNSYEGRANLINWLQHAAQTVPPAMTFPRDVSNRDRDLMNNAMQTDAGREALTQWFIGMREKLAAERQAANRAAARERYRTAQGGIDYFDAPGRYRESRAANLPFEISESKQRNGRRSRPRSKPVSKSLIDRFVDVAEDFAPRIIRGPKDRDPWFMPNRLPWPF